ncbi:MULTISPECIES: DUF6884 domain-containing protein [Streptomyces]|uniref:DUF6884 domain-containing protein n=1 Tax=Streptomyces zinciresistens K42 TaxID=700597 RepID=G2G7B2_9ACTN|nr:MULTISPECIES: DUF6884 domain-containing protein [Streptomyces]EGX60653.1 hypothetical protein SZN_06871 [Streptomyces zinciresistens K42]MDT9695869.1 hypothetical protein [Streptomyces sp. P17]
MPLSPTGAKILASHENGIVTGHPAALDRLEGDRLICRANGVRVMTEAGRQALRAWLDEHGEPPQDTAPGLLPKLPPKPHEAVITAARRPDQLVAGRDDEAYHRGETWFRTPTLKVVNAAGYADVRPASWRAGTRTWEESGASLYLTEAGREYARQRGSVNVRRRRVVIVQCGDKKAEPSWETYHYRGVIPAGQLYIGQYHRSLRQAADALTDVSLIRILSALHGIVTLAQPLPPYNVRLGDERAVTAEKVALHTAALGTDDADVIFLGAHSYADLLRVSVPHLFTPLSGGIGEHRGLCKRASEDSDLREAWWEEAAKLFDRHHPQP